MTPIQYLMLQPSRVPRHLAFARQPSAAELAWRYAAVRGTRDDALERLAATDDDTHYRLFLAYGFFFDLCFAQGVAAETIATAQRRLGIAAIQCSPETCCRLATSRLEVHFRELGVAFAPVSLREKRP